MVWKLEKGHVSSLILVILFQQQICVILNVLLIKRLKDWRDADILATCLATAPNGP